MPDGIESFRVAAERALRDQRVQFDLKQREEDLVRLQAENVEMKAKMKEMKASMEANIEDRERVIMYKVKRIDELQDKLARYNLVSTIELRLPPCSREEDETGRMDRAVHTVTEQLGIVTAERDLLRSKCVVSDATLKDMEAFQAVKGSLEAELARLQAENTQIQAACAARLREVEVSHVMHLQRMKREKDDDVARTRRDMEKAMLDSLDGTTRRAVLENEKLTLELSYQSSKLEKMISQNEVLKRSKIESRNNTDVHYSPQVIESIRLPHIVDTGDRPYVSKAEYLESSTSHARPSRRTADGSYTART
ncbi:hypothetical protein DYB30_011145 [Aphanomyces astaci]|uniref:Cilia- and flagella-associated protein 157 n=1 Tax=Aphanomyces astaci TaxID=112090 RepID=A0A397CWQ3_APHAT|nr:hypothetical protein DYB30_011145 [Aphanomyces astaci]RHY64382.1 hypothetical protein DYB38_009735 [Aphanomyces astaci]